MFPQQRSEAKNERQQARRESRARIVNNLDETVRDSTRKKKIKKKGIALNLARKQILPGCLDSDTSDHIVRQTAKSRSQRSRSGSATNYLKTLAKGGDPVMKRRGRIPPVYKLVLFHSANLLFPPLLSGIILGWIPVKNIYLSYEDSSTFDIFKEQAVFFFCVLPLTLLVLNNGVVRSNHISHFSISQNY